MKDATLPAGKWEFSKEVADAFEDMLERSIPQYPVMRQVCTELALRFVQPKTDIVDLGCARGDAMSPLVDKFGAQNRFIGVEVSQSMLQVCRERFKGLINVGVVDIQDFDLRKGYPKVKSSVTLCVLTLQFIPIEHRQRILRDIYRSTVNKGALILVEKVLGNTSEMDELLMEFYLNQKRKNGYTEEQIQRKRMSLEGVLVPVTARWNEELLTNAGFSHVDCFWRFLNFAGWVAVKE